MAKKENNTTEKTQVKRTFEGEVISTGANKTITVRVDRIKMHPVYRKQYTVSKKYAVHDENNDAVNGDRVVFEACRPLSKSKRWRLVRIVSASK